MSVFTVFTSLSFPTAAIGAGVQMKKNDEKINVEGSTAIWQTWYSILLWVVELGGLWLAALFSGAIQAQVTYLEEYEHSDHLRSSIMFNTISFYSRAIIVSIVVLLNIGSCSSPGIARTVQQTICCGDMWTNKRSRQNRNTCLGLFWLLEQISFCLPGLALVLMSNSLRVWNTRGPPGDSKKLEKTQENRENSRKPEKTPGNSQKLEKTRGNRENSRKLVAPGSRENSREL